VAVALAAVNVFGGFLVTQRMLEMFKKKEPKAVAKAEATKKAVQVEGHA
jgi:NAD(P) transhydrogenase subunit alpha